MDFKSYKKEQSKKTQPSTDDYSTEQVKKAQSIIDGFSGKNSSELYGELINRFQDEVSAGRMDKEKLMTMVKGIEAFMSDAEKERMKQIIDSL